MGSSGVARALRAAAVVLLIVSGLTLVRRRTPPPGSAGIVTDLTSSDRGPQEDSPPSGVPGAPLALTVLPSTSTSAAPPPTLPTAAQAVTTLVRPPTPTAAPRPPPSRSQDITVEALPPVVTDPEQGGPAGYGGLGRVTTTADAGVTIDLESYPDPAVTYTPASRRWSIAVHDPRCERVVRVDVDFGDGTSTTVSGAGTLIPCQGPEGWNYGSYSHRYPGLGRYQLAVTVIMSPQAPPPTLDLYRARQLVVVSAS